MIKRLATYLTKVFVQNEIVNEEDSDIYIYGLEGILTTLSTILFISILGLMTGTFIFALIFLVLFASLKPYTGGYHAKTYLGCLLTTTGLYLTLLTTLNYVPQSYQLTVSVVFGIIASFAIILIPPQVSSGRVVSPLEVNKCKKTCRIILLTIIVTCIILYVLDSNLIKCILAVSCVLLEIAIGKIVITKDKKRGELCQR